VRPFRILSLDGGGVRGAFTASVLAALERETGRAVADHFDLIVGTSTGGIIALGLGLGLNAAEIRDFYVAQGPAIFPSTGLRHRLGLTFRQLVAPKRSRTDLEKALTGVFGERTLGEARCRLVLTCFESVTARIYLLKTAHDARFTGEYRARAVDCALATAAAPTYYQASPFPLRPGESYIDGGVWANCPAMVGVTEAIAFLGAAPQDIDVLSIGTVAEPFGVSTSRRMGGILQWNAGLLELLFRGQAEAALAHAGLLTGGGVYRIDALVRPGRFRMDDARGIADLVALGDGEGRKRAHVASVTARFLTGTPAAPFAPAHATDVRAASPDR
jgi:patatin-like phospholipase/acyl hydrolase